MRSVNSIKVILNQDLDLKGPKCRKESNQTASEAVVWEHLQRCGFPLWTTSVAESENDRKTGMCLRLSNRTCLLVSGFILLVLGGVLYLWVGPKPNQVPPPTLQAPIIVTKPTPGPKEHSTDQTDSKTEEPPSSTSTTTRSHPVEDYTSFEGLQEFYASKLDPNCGLRSAPAWSPDTTYGITRGYFQSGHLASYHQPWYVEFFKYQLLPPLIEYVCSGVLVSADWVITVAVCSDQIIEVNLKIYAVAGHTLQSNVIEQGRFGLMADRTHSQEVDVKAILADGHDLALVKLLTRFDVPVRYSGQHHLSDATHPARRPGGST